ncbi:MAG: high-potential iron-sulfur protein [Pseudomonadota bacterium]
MTLRRRQLIQAMSSVPAAQAAGLLGAASLLAACGDKSATTAGAPAPAPSAPPAAAPPPVAAAPAPAPALEAAPPAAAGTSLPLVDEKDAQAVALGYVSDATRADKVKFPKYEAGQQCANCALYQGPAIAPQAPCPLYPGKAVAARAWCGSYTKKTV